MGQIKHYNNGKWTIYTSGEDLSGYTGTTNTYYIGVNNTDGDLSKVNPDGELINLELNYDAVTHSQIMVLINNNLIKTGYYYLILDANLTDGGVLIKGVSSDKIALDGEGIFLNADYQGIGDYDSVSPAYVSNKGIWGTTSTPVLVGDVVVYDNKNFVNLTSNWGSEPTSDTTNWLELTRTTKNGYILEIDIVKYDLENNVIIYREDKRGNKVQKNSSFISSLELFQWGRDKVVGNSILNDSYMNIKNSQPSFKYNYVDYSYIEDNSKVQGNAKCESNTIINESGLEITNNIGKINNNNINAGSYFYVNDILNNNCELSYNTVQNGSYFDFYSGYTGRVNYNLIGGGKTLRIFNLNNSYIEYNLINSVVVINNATATMSSCRFNTGYNSRTFDLTNFTSGKICENGYSNFEMIVDFNTYYNVGTKTLTLPSNGEHIGKFYLRNTGSNIVEKIVSSAYALNYNIALIPENGQTVSFLHTDISVATSNCLISNGGAITDTLTGRANGGDFIEYSYGGTMLIKTNVLIA